MVDLASSDSNLYQTLCSELLNYRSESFCFPLSIQQWNLECGMPLPVSLKFSSVFTTAENPELFLLARQGHQTKSFLSRYLGEISGEGKIALMLVSGGAATVEVRELQGRICLTNANPSRHAAIKVCSVKSTPAPHLGK